MRKHALLLIPLAVLGLLLVPPSATPTTAPCAARPPISGGAGIPVEVVTAHGVASALIDDSAAGRAFVGTLPLTLRLRDSFGIALVGSLPASLNAVGMTASCSVQPGEIAWSPEDNALAIVLSAEPATVASPGVIRLGELTTGPDAIPDLRSPITIREG